jgi:opacity protein-like surface antigen
MRLAAAMMLGMISLPVQAAALRDYCPVRPGLGTPACTIDAGHVSVEVGLADWTLDRSSSERDSTIFYGAALARFGVGDHGELQIGWDGFGRDSDLDRSTGMRSVAHRAGDLTVALRRNLTSPDGSGFSAAVQPFATLPVGRMPIGRGDWGAGLIVPVSYELNDSLSIATSPEIDAAVDEDGRGRHFAYGATIGMADKLSDAITATLEYQGVRDRDPVSHATQSLAGLSIAWQPRDDLQLDIGSNAGLNHATPDVQVYLGVSRRF